MTIQYEGLRFNLVEDTLRQGGLLGIFNSQGYMLSRVSKGVRLLASNTANSICLLMQKTEWQLKADKLCYRPPFKRTTGEDYLDQFIKSDGKLYIHYVRNQFEGMLIKNDKIIVTKHASNTNELILKLEIA